MRIIKAAQRAARTLFAIVDVVQESDPTKREVQCEGERDETETGREIFRKAWHLGPGGFKHRAIDGEKALLLRLPGGIVLGVHLEDGEPTDLDAGDTAIYSSGGAQVRCKGSTVQIGTGAGGKLIRLDYFQTQWDSGPRANHLLHKHLGAMPGPGSTGTPDTDLGEIPDSVGSTEDHGVK